MEVFQKLGRGKKTNNNQKPDPLWKQQKPAAI